MTDEQILKKAFEITEDRRFIVKAPYVKVYFNEEYFKRKIAEINGSDVLTIGLFYIDIYGLDDKEFDIDHPKNPIRVLFKMPMQMMLSPSNITEERNGDKELITVLEFLQNDVFIKSLLFVRTWKTVGKLIDLLLKGFMPKELGYDEVFTFIDNACIENKTNLLVCDTITENLIGVLARDPHDIMKPFRVALHENPRLKMKDKKFVKIDTIGKLNSTFAAISSGDTKRGITTSINRKRYDLERTPSTMEETLSDV